MNIYDRALKSLLAEGVLTVGSQVLVTCGGDTDARSLRRFGISQTIITNLDERRSSGIGNLEWRHCDAEDIPFPDGSFDWGMVHLGLHHCRSPHRGLLELMRIAQRGVLVIEARDSLLMRTAIRLGLVPEYEIEDCALDRQGRGGLRNSGVPNFIYRWTEREVRKAVESAYPDEINDLRFFYGLRLPHERHTMSAWPKRMVVKIAGIAAKALFALFPRQGNMFAFAIIRTGKSKPWVEKGRLSRKYRLGFDPTQYKRAA